jgi:predicted amidohydrolase YtcJ
MSLCSAAIVAAGLSVSAPAQAQDQEEPQTLFTNVHVFDGVNEQRIENASVLVEGNLIKAVSTDAIDAPNATVIDGEGRTLTPGFIELHAHLMLMGPTLPAMEANTTWEDFAIHGARMAEMYLMRASPQSGMQVAPMAGCAAQLTQAKLKDRVTFLPVHLSERAAVMLISRISPLHRAQRPT